MDEEKINAQDLLQQEITKGMFPELSK